MLHEGKVIEVYAHIMPLKHIPLKQQKGVNKEALFYHVPGSTVKLFIAKFMI